MVPHFCSSTDLKQAILARFSLSQLSSEPQLYVWDGHIKDIFDNLPSQE